MSERRATKEKRLNRIDLQIKQLNAKLERLEAERSVLISQLKWGGAPHVSIDILGLSVRPGNALKRRGIQTVADLIAEVDKWGWDDFYVPNVGDKSVQEIRNRLIECGFLIYA